MIIVWRASAKFSQVAPSPERNCTANSCTAMTLLPFAVRSACGQPHGTTPASQACFNVGQLQELQRRFEPRRRVSLRRLQGGGWKLFGLVRF